MNLGHWLLLKISSISFIGVESAISLNINTHRLFIGLTFSSLSSTCTQGEAIIYKDRKIINKIKTIKILNYLSKHQ